jgi:hypothetical protein
MSKTYLFRVIQAALSGMVLLWSAGAAQAAMVVYDDTGFISGKSVGYSSNEFTIGNSGVYTATLKDFKFPDLFQNLGLIITANGTDELGRISGPGSFNFAAAPGIYTASLYGLAGGAMELGLYGVSVAPVALPPALVLLGSSLLVLVGLPRMRKDRDSTKDAVAA